MLTFGTSLCMFIASVLREPSKAAKAMKNTVDRQARVKMFIGRSRKSFEILKEGDLPTPRESGNKQADTLCVDRSVIVEVGATDVVIGEPVPVADLVVPVTLVVPAPSKRKVKKAVQLAVAANGLVAAYSEGFAFRRRG